MQFLFIDDIFNIILTYLDPISLIVIKMSNKRFSTLDTKPINWYGFLHQMYKYGCKSKDLLSWGVIFDQTKINLFDQRTEVSDIKSIKYLKQKKYLFDEEINY